MKVAVLAESRPGERRVAIVPGTLRELSKAGVEVTVVRGAGVAAGFPDREYEEAGAALAPDAGSALRGAHVVVKVQPPTDEELRALPRGGVLVSLMNPLGDVEAVRRAADAGLTCFALELIPRTTRAQSMDVLSSQATVAGYKAALMGADHLPKLLPMLMTAAGTIRPGKVLVLGAGVAGLQAIATARRLGAKVEAFDVRPAVKEQVQSLGATFLETEHEVAAEGEGGYAKELSEEQHRKELELIAGAVVDADVVITTAQIPGRPAPVLITEAMLDTMRPGSVVVDLASETGGNCEATRMGETVERNGVKVLGPVNLPATVPYHASQMFSKNVATFLKELLDEGELALDFDNDVVGPTCLVHGGEVRNARVRDALGLGPPPEASAPPPGPAEGAADATTGTGTTPPPTS
ncbi:MAG: Re/Si-specific NAD(P)(+) transhydrogenase subunit alpha [Gemmatimonadetes bacterium]|nr:Re/Si-specific NAD(P)(+) transhydrogenase subunit alpha [Gemmatimonadota bacterium]